MPSELERAIRERLAHKISERHSMEKIEKSILRLEICRRLGISLPETQPKSKSTPKSKPKSIRQASVPIITGAAHETIEDYLLKRAFLPSDEHFVPKDEESLVYLLVDKNMTVVKVGRSKDAYKRLAELQTGSPVPLRVFKVFHDGRDLESSLHRVLKPYRLHGEWFSLSDGVINLFEYLDKPPFNEDAVLADTVGSRAHFGESDAVAGSGTYY